MEKRKRMTLFAVVSLTILLTLPLYGARPAESAAPSGGPTGTVVVGMSSLHEETFLPWNGGFARTFYLSPIYEFLVYINPETGALVPGLATKWEMSQDAKTWTFWLRQGIQFHEGWGEVTADDVKYSIERLIAPDSIVGPSSPMRSLIAKVEAPEKYKVIIYLKNPDPELDRGYFGSGQALWIVCKKYLETAGDKAANTHPIGTGPFTLLEAKKGSSIKLKVIDGIEKHWRVKPDFQNITFLIVPEEATRVAMLRTGEVDLAPINFDSIESIKASGINVFSIPTSWTPVIRFGGLVQPKPARYKADNPWVDKRVRQALNYAVDKEAIVKNIFHGMAKPAMVDNPCREWLNIKPYPYDPAKAKQLLAQAGYPDGFKITLKTFTTSPGAELPIIGEAVAMYWQAVGLKVTIVPVDYPSLRAAWTTDKALDYTWTHRGQAFPTSLVAINASYVSSSSFCIYATEKTDSMIKAISEELNPKKREDLTRELGEYLGDEAANVFLAFANEPWGASKNIGKWPTLSVAPVNIDLITRAK
jgi:peptide/nickel transport system substrate-binding protein